MEPLSERPERASLTLKDKHRLHEADLILNRRDRTERICDRLIRSAVLDRMKVPVTEKQRWGSSNDR